MHYVNWLMDKSRNQITNSMKINFRGNKFEKKLKINQNKNVEKNEKKKNYENKNLEKNRRLIASAVSRQILYKILNAIFVFAQKH